LNATEAAVTITGAVLDVILSVAVLAFPFSAPTLLVGRQEGHQASENLGVLLVVTI